MTILASVMREKVDISTPVRNPDYCVTHSNNECGCDRGGLNTRMAFIMKQIVDAADMRMSACRFWTLLLDEVSALREQEFVVEQCTICDTEHEPLEDMFVRW